jgi:subtilisin family serine protease
MRRSVLAIAGVAALAGCSLGAGDGDPPSTSEAVSAIGESDEPTEIYVVLEGPPAAEMLPPGVPVGHPKAVAATRQRIAELEVLRDLMRPQLLAHGAVVIAELSRLVNVFHIQVPQHAVDHIRKLPHVVAIEPVPTWHKTLKTGIPLVGAPQAWGQATPFHGEGITIGILDTGVDYMHADLGGAGDVTEFDSNDPLIVEPGSFPTARVVGGLDVVGDDYNPNNGNSLPLPDADPIDCGGHGSHVAGIAAGNGVLTDGTTFTGPYDASFDPTIFLVAPGVAPKASIFAIKIFGCSGSTRVVATGLEIAADPNNDGDFSDRLDVVNASLGSPWGIQSFVQQQLIANYTTVGGLFVASAGNEGHTFYITGTPAVYDHTLSVAASVDTGHSTLTLESPAGFAGDYAADQASFSELLEVTGDVSGELVYGQPAFGCEPFENAGELAGKIAFVDRGDCLFHTKFSNAEAAGAIAIVVANHTAGAGIFSMAPPDSESTSAIPGVMVSFEDGVVFKNAMQFDTTTVVLSADIFFGDGSELVAGLSSRGPRTLGGALKPEIAAPGVSVDSADVGTGTGPTPKSGTSMASPFVAGAAALVREARPALPPIEVKAALMNTAVSIRNSEGLTYPVSMQGSGRVDVAAAVSKNVTAQLDGGGGLVALSFGAIIAEDNTSESRTVSVKNRGSDAVTYSISASQSHELDGVTVSVEPKNITVPPGSSATFDLVLSLNPTLLGAPGPDPLTATTQFDLPRHFLVEAAGHVYLEHATESLVLPFHAVVNAAGSRVADSPRGCPVDGEATVISVPLTGHTAHPEPTVSAFQLGLIHELNEDGVGAPEVAKLDIRAIGVASDLAAVDNFSEASLHFGVAVEGPWTTPALGGIAIIGVLIDSDLDSDADYAITIEPYRRDDPWADVLAAVTYAVSDCLTTLDFDDCDRVDTKRYLNLAPVNVARTQPYNNSVAVLSAFAEDIGLSEGNTSLRYAVFSRGVVGLVDVTEWVNYDVAAPGIDPALHAPKSGRPLYIGDERVRVQLDPALLGPSLGGERQLPELLLLHHNNVPGKRWETVELGEYVQQPIGLSHEFPGAIAADRPASHQIIVSNPNDKDLFDVSLNGTLTGAAVHFITPSKGTCDALSCTFGTIAPGESVSITIQFDALAPDVLLVATVQSEAGCAQSLSHTVSIVDGEVTKPTPLDVNGGCGCRLNGSKREQSWWWLLAGLSLFAVRRR